MSFIKGPPGGGLLMAFGRSPDWIKIKNPLHEDV